MNRVLKYHLTRHLLKFVLEIPKDCKILCVQNQNDCAVLYVSGDIDLGYQKRHIASYLTGSETPVGEYIGTVMLDSGSFVLHFYDLGGD